MKDITHRTDAATVSLLNADVMAFFEDSPYLSRLTYRFSQAGIDTVSRILEKGETALRKEFSIRKSNMNRIRTKLEDFGLHLNS